MKKSIMNQIFILLITCTVIMCTSCSKDKENENNVVSIDENGNIIPDKNDITTNKDGKKLVSKLIYDCLDNDEDDFEVIFSYDSKGNIIGTTTTSTADHKKYTKTLIRDGNKITYTGINLENQEKDHQLWTLDKAGRIINKEYSYDTNTFIYDEAGHLKVVNSSTVTTTFNWQDENIVLRKMFVRPYSTILNYSYYSYPNNINIDFTEDLWGTCELTTYLGKSNKNLLKSVTSSYLNYSIKYEFENGNISLARKYQEGKEKKLEGIYYFYYK